MIARVATALAAAATAAPALAQVPPRASACIAANDAVTAARLGHDRAGRGVKLDVARAVSLGDAAARLCAGDDSFLLAYALARIDLARDTKRGTPQTRTVQFNAAVADLERIKARVLAGRSDRYEIFNILGLIYYDTGQFDRSLAVIDASAPFLNRMSAASRQKTFVTRGMAQAQLGQSANAARSFDNAVRFGHPEAAAIKRKMLGARN